MAIKNIIKFENGRIMEIGVEEKLDSDLIELSGTDGNSLENKSDGLYCSAGNVDLTEYYDKTEVDDIADTKQDNLNAPDNANKILNGELQWVDMPSGGSGGMAMTVIDYDPSLPANQTVTTVGIDQAFPVADTCTISGNTVTVVTPANTRAVIGLPLSTDAEFEFDFGNMQIGSGVYFLKSTDDFMTAFTTTNVAYHAVARANSYSITQLAMKGDGTAPTYPVNAAELPINPTLKFMTGEAIIFLETGLSTMQEVRDMLAGNGSSEQDINDTIAAYTSMNWLMYNSANRPESFQIPKEFDTIYFGVAGQNTGDTFTIGVTKNNETTYSVPSGLSDGTYLKALGNCTLLGKYMETGDFLQLYNNSNNGILIKQ